MIKAITTPTGKTRDLEMFCLASTVAWRSSEKEGEMLFTSEEHYVPRNSVLPCLTLLPARLKIEENTLVAQYVQTDMVENGRFGITDVDQTSRHQIQISTYFPQKLRGRRLRCWMRYGTGKKATKEINHCRGWYSMEDTRARKVF